MPTIRASSVLPGRRKPLTLHTADGLELVAELALPPDSDPVATIVFLHPLPTHGGMMDSHVIRKAAYRLPALARVAVLRLNTRGTGSVHGTSQGSFDAGDAERYDVAAALEYVEFAELSPVWLVGWSFGSDLALRHGCDPVIDGAVVLSPPLRTTTESDLAVWADSGKPLVALVPEHDDYLRPAEARSRFAVVPQAEVVAIEGGRHLWVGMAERALDEIVRVVAPTAYPLPRQYDGEMGTDHAHAYRNRTVAAHQRNAAER